MRVDIKIGLAVGIIVVAGAAIYVATKSSGAGSNDEPDITIPKSDVSVPLTTPAKKPLPYRSSSQSTSKPSSFQSTTSVPKVSTDKPKTDDIIAKAVETETMPTTGETHKSLTVVPPKKDPCESKGPESLRLTQLAQQRQEPAKPAAVRAVPEVRKPRYYVVQDGDSLSTISEQYYGSGRWYQQIYEVNKGTLTSVDNVRVGQKLRIPYSDELAKMVEKKQ